MAKKEGLEKEEKRLKETIVPPSRENNEYLSSLGSTPIQSGISLYDLLKRPEIKYKDIIKLGNLSEEAGPAVQEQVEIQENMRYINKQIRQVDFKGRKYAYTTGYRL